MMKTGLVLAAIVAVILSAVVQKPMKKQPSLKTEMTKCGQTPIKPNLQKTEKIMGGTIVVPYSWPWMAVGGVKGSNGTFNQFCGGTIIDAGWVMTAGHCVYQDLNPGDFMVKAAVFEKDSNDESGEQIRAVKAIHLHPKYTHDPYSHNDIALIELATPLTFNDHVQPICLTKNDTNVVTPGNIAWVTGWGQTQDPGNNSEQLRQANIPFVDYERCQQAYQHQIHEDAMVCAVADGHGVCFGDSGGPLVKQAPSGSWYQVGITSFSQECGQTEYPSVFARMQAFCGFINKTTAGKVQCQDFV